MTGLASDRPCLPVQQAAFSLWAFVCTAILLQSINPFGAAKTRPHFASPAPHRVFVETRLLFSSKLTMAVTPAGDRCSRSLAALGSQGAGHRRQRFPAERLDRSSDRVPRARARAPHAHGAREPRQRVIARAVAAAHCRVHTGHPHAALVSFRARCAQFLSSGVVVAAGGGVVEVVAVGSRRLPRAQANGASISSSPPG